MRHDSPPSQEATFRARDAVELVEGAGVLPVPEAKTVVVRAAAKVENDTENNEAGNRDDFDGREDEFSFTVRSWTGDSVPTSQEVHSGAGDVPAPNMLIPMTTTRNTVIHTASFTF